MWILNDVYVGYISPVSDTLFMVWMISAISTLRLILVNFIYLPLGNRYLPRIPIGKLSLSEISSEQQTIDTSPSSKKIMDNSTRMDDQKPQITDSIDSKLLRKFVISCWKATAYVLLISSGVYLIIDQPFMFRTRELWTDWPLIKSSSVAMKVFYLGELGFYLEELGALYVEPKMRDRLQMFVHHIVTIFLICGSYMFGFWKVGLAIMLLHDISDPLMELAKLTLYCQHRTIANGLFILFASVFVMSRCIYFPARILWSC